MSETSLCFDPRFINWT